jgi:hypothetical protein
MPGGGSALDDVRVERRVRGRLGPGVLVRFQRISAAKSPQGNHVLELSDDGAVRIARHSGVVGVDWQEPMDVELPDEPNASAKSGAVRKIKKLLAKVEASATPAVVTGEIVKDGVFEVVTLPPEHVVVYDGVDNDLLRELRKLAATS